MRAIRMAALASAVLIAACTTGEPTSQPTPGPPTPSPTASPAPSTAGFTMEVIPPEEPVEVRAAIPGQRICFLVTIADQGSATSPVTIGATASGATIERILPADLRPGRVGEVWIVPDATTTETTASVTISATRGAVTESVTRSILVTLRSDEGRARDAQPYFERWGAWLAAEHPELGITADTTWEPVFVSTLLVVSHYAYYSDAWEMTVAWHVMVSPYDWSEIHLRQRFTETRPSLAFRIDSFSGKTPPHAVEPPEVVVR